MSLVIVFAMSSDRPVAQLDLLADLVAAGGLHLAPVEDLERQAAADRLRLDQVLDRGRPELVVGQEGEPLLLLDQVHRDALEVEPLRALAANLVEGVAQLLGVELADDVERDLPGHRTSCDADCPAVPGAGRGGLLRRQYAPPGPAVATVSAVPRRLQQRADRSGSCARRP